MLMSMIPDDVLETILLGLPALDLFRCKAVCKAWRRVISSGDFVAAHLKRAKSDPSSHHLLVRNRRLIDLHKPVAGGPFLSFACFSSSDLVIVGSANGLICIAGEGDRVPSSPEDIWILNPVTGLSKKLPYSSRFPSSIKNSKLAFWCDEDGVYKVAKFMSNTGDETTLELWVSTCPCSWTDICTIELQFHLHPRRCHPCDVLIQGLAAYWIIINKDFGDDYITVVSLDLKTLSVTKFIPLSERLLFMSDIHFFRPVNGYSNYVLFGGSLKGRFVLVAWSTYNRVYSLWTLEMNDITAEARWVEKFVVDFVLYPFEKCLGIVNDKLVLTCYDDMEVALCDLVTTGKVEVIETGSKLETVTLDAACGFVGSLVSMDGFGYEWNYLLHKYMAIKWPYSSNPYPRWKESSTTNLRTNLRKRRRRWDQVNTTSVPVKKPWHQVIHRFLNMVSAVDYEY